MTIAKSTFGLASQSQHGSKNRAQRGQRQDAEAYNRHSNPICSRAERFHLNCDPSSSRDFPHDQQDSGRCNSTRRMHTPIITNNTDMHCCGERTDRPKKSPRWSYLKNSAMNRMTPTPNRYTAALTLKASEMQTRNNSASAQASYSWTGSSEVLPTNECGRLPAGYRTPQLHGMP